MVKLPRPLKLGCVGDDVYAAKRMIARYLGDGPVKDTRAAHTFGPFFRARVNKVRRDENMKPTGVFDRALFFTMVDFELVDAYSEWLLERYARQHQPPSALKLVRPWQGWESLHRSLWEPYAIGITRYGLRDAPGLASGTFNPSSRLPSGRPSEHAMFPARAFDLDIGRDTGWRNEPARRFFMEMTKHPAVAYVILGDKIFSKDRAHEGIRPYTGGGHLNHVHVSTYR